jgi:hypothetical protein
MLYPIDSSCTNSIQFVSVLFITFYYSSLLSITLNSDTEFQLLMHLFLLLVLCTRHSVLTLAGFRWWVTTLGILRISGMGSIVISTPDTLA